MSKDSESKAAELSKEQIYDQQIAPLMSQIAEICQQHEINLQATFFLRQENNQTEEIDEIWYTTELSSNAPAGIRLMGYLAASRGNLDKFLIKCLRDSALHGHQSVFLQTLGIESEVSESEWLRSAANNPVFGFLNNPEEDIYTSEDGKPLNEDPKTAQPTTEELKQAADHIYRWLQDETDYSGQILFDLPSSIYAMLLDLTPEEILAAFQSLAGTKQQESDRA